MITLIGTGHVFNLSHALINIFENKQPKALCVELDNQRYNALMMKQTKPKQYKETTEKLPFIYKILAEFQERVAKEYDVTVGEEMLVTINYAKDHQLPVFFIDLNAQQLFNEMLKTMSFSEKIRFLLSGISGFFVNKKQVEKELSEIEENLDKYLEKIGRKFPTIKHVLIDKRNSFMAHQLQTINEKYDKIIAIVGDGHIPGLTRLLNKK